MLGQEDDRVSEAFGGLGGERDVLTGQLPFPRLCDRSDVHAVGQVDGESHSVPFAALTL